MAVTSAGYTYDVAGNMNHDGTYNYTFDAEGNILTMNGNGTSASYVYDGGVAQV